MLIVFGQKRCGKVDQVPGLFYVITEFFHVYYFPLIPLGSYLILDSSEYKGSLQGTRISMSLKSVLMGWFRALLIAGFFAGLVIAVVAAAKLADHHPGMSLKRLVIPLVAAGTCMFVYWLTMRWQRAGLERALALAEQVGLPAEYVQKCFEPPVESFEESEEPDRYASEGT